MNQGEEGVLPRLVLDPEGNDAPISPTRNMNDSISSSSRRRQSRSLRQARQGSDQPTQLLQPEFPKVASIGAELGLTKEPDAPATGKRRLSEVSLNFSPQDGQNRALRHLGQLAHLQETAKAAQKDVEEHRSEWVQRENNRLLHMALRQDKLASSLEPIDSKGQAEFSTSQHSVSPRDSRDVDDVEGFGHPSPATFSAHKMKSIRRSKLSRLPPSFMGTGKQRTRLVTLIKKMDLKDASVLGALLRRQPLHPKGVFRDRWDKLLMLAVVFTMVAVPLEIAFFNDSLFFTITGVALDFLFIFDVVLSFRTAYREVDDEYVQDFGRIAWHYFRTWFFLDAIAAFPINTILAIVNLEKDEVFAFLKVIKVFRVVRLRYLFHALAGLKTSAVIYLNILIAFFVVYAHWMACLFWYLGTQENSQESWIWTQSSLPGLNNLTIRDKYSTSMYWALTTISTVGYGDISPSTMGEQLYTIFFLLLGVTMYASVIGVVSYILRTQFDAGLQYENYSRSLRVFGRHHHLPPDMQDKIQQYYDFVWDRKKSFRSKSILGDLPLELRAEVAAAMHLKLFRDNPLLFHCSTTGFRQIFAARLSPAAVRIPDELLFFQGDDVNQVFFVKKGSVILIHDVDSNRELVVGRRSDGQHCGDIGLFQGVSLDNTDANGKEIDSSKQPVHFLSCFVAEFSDITSINASDLTQLLAQFPREKAMFKGVAVERFKLVSRLLARKDELERETEESRSRSDPNQDSNASTFLRPGMRFMTTPLDKIHQSFYSLSERVNSRDDSVPQHSIPHRFRHSLPMGLTRRFDTGEGKAWMQDWNECLDPSRDNDVVRRVMNEVKQKRSEHLMQRSGEESLVQPPMDLLGFRNHSFAESVGDDGNELGYSPKPLYRHPYASSLTEDSTADNELCSKLLHSTNSEDTNEVLKKKTAMATNQLQHLVSQVQRINHEFASLSMHHDTRRDSEGACSDENTNGTSLDEESQEESTPEKPQDQAVNQVE